MLLSLGCGVGVKVIDLPHKDPPLCPRINAGEGLLNTIFELHVERRFITKSLCGVGASLVFARESPVLS